MMPIQAPMADHTGSAHVPHARRGGSLGTARRTGRKAVLADRMSQDVDLSAQRFFNKGARLRMA